MEHWQFGDCSVARVHSLLFSRPSVHSSLMCVAIIIIPFTLHLLFVYSVPPRFPILITRLFTPRWLVHLTPHCLRPTDVFTQQPSSLQPTAHIVTHHLPPVHSPSPCSLTKPHLCTIHFIYVHSSPLSSSYYTTNIHSPPLVPSLATTYLFTLHPPPSRPAINLLTTHHLNLTLHKPHHFTLPTSSISIISPPPSLTLHS